MPSWKLTIFVNAIKARMKQEERTAQEIIEDYAKLRDEEKNEILVHIN